MKKKSLVTSQQSKISNINKQTGKSDHDGEIFCLKYKYLIRKEKCVVFRDYMPINTNNVIPLIDKCPHHQGLFTKLHLMIMPMTYWGWWFNQQKLNLKAKKWTKLYLINKNQLFNIQYIMVIKIKSIVCLIKYMAF